MFGWLKSRHDKAEPAPQPRSPAERMIRLQRADVYYLHIAKSGSTFLKNLFYYLDHRRLHPDGDAIHGAPELLRATPDEFDRIRNSRHAFAVVREPVSRFMSLYFDKIYGDGPRNFPDLQEYFTKTIGLDLSRDLDVAGHRRNCDLLIDWIGENLAGNTDQPVNFHWRRQVRRLKRVESLDLELLTLDGLDWQLPLLLESVLPDIREAMVAVRSRNQSHAPVDKDDVLSDSLRAKIETTYASDKRLYDQAQARWARVSGPDRLRVINAGDLPIYGVAIPKVGCTYLKNLFYMLEHGEAYGDPARIHGSGAVSHAILEKGAAPEAVKFIVLRDPAERFFSLYYDKVLGAGPQAFAWITKRLVEKRGFDVRADTPDKHRANARALLGYLELRFKTQTPADLNPHWRPQTETAQKVAGFGFVGVLLEALEPQLRALAGERIEGLHDAMDAVPENNAAARAVASDKILTPDMARRISALYGADQALYEHVKRGWAENGTAPKLQDYYGKT